MRKVVIVGAGHVGSCLALMLACQNVATDIVLVDKRAARAQAEAADMACALGRMNLDAQVRAGSYADCADANEVVVCAAAPVRLGQTRNQMFAKNLEIVRSVVAETEAAGFTGLYVMVANPVDLLTFALVDQLGIAPERVLGTGCVLDSMRLADMLGTAMASATALCLGEHGENLIVDWQRTTLNGEPVAEERREELRRATIDLAYNIVKGKGSTSYGIAQAVVSILQARDGADERILPLSMPLNGAYGLSDIALSVPARFDAQGVPRVVELDLAPEIQDQLVHTADELRTFYHESIAAEA